MFEVLQLSLVFYLVQAPTAIFYFTPTSISSRLSLSPTTTSPRLSLHPNYHLNFLPPPRLPLCISTSSLHLVVLPPSRLPPSTSPSISALTYRSSNSYDHASNHLQPDSAQYPRISDR